MLYEAGAAAASAEAMAAPLDHRAAIAPLISVVHRALVSLRDVNPAVTQQTDMLILHRALTDLLNLDLDLVPAHLESFHYAIVSFFHDIDSVTGTPTNEDGILALNYELRDLSSALHTLFSLDLTVSTAPLNIDFTLLQQAVRTLIGTGTISLFTSPVALSTVRQALRVIYNITLNPSHNALADSTLLRVTMRMKKIMLISDMILKAIRKKSLLLKKAIMKMSLVLLQQLPAMENVRHPLNLPHIKTTKIY